MKFPRNARIFRGSFDIAPFMGVFFILVIFQMLGTLVYTPGVKLELPLADDLPGTDAPTVSVAIDTGGRLFFKNQEMDAKTLRAKLREAVVQAGEPLTMVVQADKSVTHEMLVNLTLLAREAGIANAWLATLPRSFEAPAPASAPANRKP